MDKNAFKAKVIESATARFPDLTGAQVSALADKLIARETDKYKGHEVWLWADAAEILEQVGYRLDNMRLETPADFVPPPSPEVVYATLLKEKENSDPRTLFRMVQSMTPDERLAAVEGMTLQSTLTPKSETRETEGAAFTGPGDPAFRAHIEKHLGIPEHKQSARANMGYYREHVARLRHKAREQAAQNVREAEVKKSLSPSEARTLARAKAKLDKQGSRAYSGRA